MEHAASPTPFIAGMNCGGPINSLSISPDGSHVVVVGREGEEVVCLKAHLCSFEDYFCPRCCQTFRKTEPKSGESEFELFECRCEMAPDGT